MLLIKFGVVVGGLVEMAEDDRRDPAASGRRAMTGGLTGVRPTSRLPELLRHRSVQFAIAGWLATNVLLLTLTGGHLPFHASPLAGPPTMDAVLSADAIFVEVFALMIVVHVLTRRRTIPDLDSRAPATPIAKKETLAVVAYGVAAMAGGFLLGPAFGWHAFSFHVDNMVIRTGHQVVPAEVLCWAAYNVIAYAVLPLAVFRRRYSTEQLSLCSSNRRADLLVILVILALESAVQLSLVSSSILDLNPRQVLLGAPLTFVLGFAGTVLPTMVFIYCILTPRYLKLTGSIPATVILGGLTYALLHFFDGWTDFTSPTDALLSVLYLLLFYTGPGMFKTFLTVRTGNAWVHVWAYHAIAPHTLIDTPMIVEVFGIR